MLALPGLSARPAGRLVRLRAPAPARRFAVTAVSPPATPSPDAVLSFQEKKEPAASAAVVPAAAKAPSPAPSPAAKKAASAGFPSPNGFVLKILTGAFRLVLTIAVVSFVIALGLAQYTGDVAPFQDNFASALENVVPYLKWLLAVAVVLARAAVAQLQVLGMMALIGSANALIIAQAYGLMAWNAFLVYAGQGLVAFLGFVPVAGYVIQAVVEVLLAESAGAYAAFATTAVGQYVHAVLSAQPFAYPASLLFSLSKLGLEATMGLVADACTALYTLPAAKALPLGLLAYAFVAAARGRPLVKPGPAVYTPTPRGAPPPPAPTPRPALRLTPPSPGSLSLAASAAANLPLAAGGPPPGALRKPPPDSASAVGTAAALSGLRAAGSPPPTPPPGALLPARAARRMARAKGASASPPLSSLPPGSRDALVATLLARYSKELRGMDAADAASPAGLESLAAQSTPQPSPAARAVELAALAFLAAPGLAYRAARAAPGAFSALGLPRFALQNAARAWGEPLAAAVESVENHGLLGALGKSLGGGEVGSGVMGGPFGTEGGAEAGRRRAQQVARDAADAAAATARLPRVEAAAAAAAAARAADSAGRVSVAKVGGPSAQSIAAEIAAAAGGGRAAPVAESVAVAATTDSTVAESESVTPGAARAAALAAASAAAARGVAAFGDAGEAR